ncbi:hypothetical protein [Flavobacterium sp. DG2-3]|uniref:hypothetical protein n=1 Tax=Flavobacterium sp. DG2-3 TaxID=3068317 RepID=UPI00273D9C21|nr:hypothetical protein [Flavobacterium sp. DG2-3]MDP5200812.1 hypothetical protein [Flavobacterium sp. DG2-3]
MNTIEKLHLIESVWRNYIWEYDFFREKLNFDDESKTNYVGVIFGYFHDTLPIITNYLNDKSPSSLNNDFLNSIGLLQVIYLQQDLVIELNKSFGFSHDITSNTNRELRNELIGHPISRFQNRTLKSFCLFGYETSRNKIVYLKYAQNNNFKFQAKEYQTNEIIENHIKLLDKNFELILNKIKRLFTEFKKQLNLILENIHTTTFEILIEEISKNFNFYFKSDIVFSRENILKTYNLKDKALRYNYNLKLFLSNLKCSLIENINTINKTYLRKKENVIEYKYIDLPSNYTFGKLYSNHPIFGINYFKERFSFDKEIIIELENMENNIGNDFQYYCSYNYLQHLINEKHPSFFNE